MRHFNKATGRFLPDWKRCSKPARDGRSIWYYGLQGRELQEARQCKRRKNHRGECSVFSTKYRYNWQTNEWVESHAL